MYATYSISLFYFAAYGVENAATINLLPVTLTQSESILKFAAFYILISFYCLTFGYLLAKKKIFIGRPAVLNQAEKRSFSLWYIGGLCVFTFGTLYFIYPYSYQVSNGPIELIKNIGVFKHLEYVSRLPLLTCYIGAYLVTIYYASFTKVSFNNKVLWTTIVFTSFFVYITSGRISQTFMHLIFILVIIGMIRNKIPAFSFKLFLRIIVVMLLGIGFFFYRIYSSMQFVGLDYDSVFGHYDGKLEILGFYIIGKGNLLDIQSFVSLDLYLNSNSIIYGKTIFQAFFLNIYQTFNISFQTPAHLFKEYYYPTSPGTPVAGAIVEAALNFGYFFGLIFFVLVGYFFAKLFYASMQSQSYITKVIYAAFYSKFILGYLKVDASTFASFIWLVVPLLLGFYLINLTAKYLHFSKSKFIKS